MITLVMNSGSEICNYYYKMWVVTILKLYLLNVVEIDPLFNIKLYHDKIFE